MKKELGQHWLNDAEALKAITSAAGLTKSDTVLEVGPGLGTLTAYLLREAGQVIAVELDAQLADNLKKSFAGSDLEVVKSDILQYDLSSLPKGYKVAANIPYYLTAPLLQKLAYDQNPPTTMALLVQKEVAERLGANPGRLSVLAISLQLKYEVKVGDVVPAKLFTPPPKVDSQIVKLTKLTDRIINVDEQSLMRLVKLGFANKRKTLINSLSSHGDFNKKMLSQIPQELDLDKMTRAQELTIQQWEKLYNLLYGENHG